MQRELDSFYKEISKEEFNIRELTKGGFSQARSKLNPSAFVEMNQNLNQTFYNEAPYLLWQGFRLIAGDGSTLNLPRNKSTIEDFGERGYGPNADFQKCIANVSILYDVLNLLVIDAQIVSNHIGEKEILLKQLEYLKKDDLLLLDRGYPSLILFFFLKAMGIQFCVRMKNDWWHAARDFKNSGEKERIVTFTLPEKDKSEMANFPEWKNSEIQCRLVRVELENGEVEILCTSLLDIQNFPHSDFKELYHRRWSIEEGFKLFKERAEVENFSGKTSRAVQQDFHAKIFMMTLSAVLAFPIEEKVKQETRQTKERKHTQKINRTNALSMTGNISIGLILKNAFQRAIAAFDKIVYKTREIVRLGRSNPRNTRRKRPYHLNSKRL